MQKKKQILIYGAVFFTCLLLIPQCNQNQEDFIYQYRIPTQIDDGWETASLEDVGIREYPINRMMDIILKGLLNNVHSILIIKDGKLVFEEYFSGYKYNYSGDKFRGDYVNFDRNTRHFLASASKSITSAALGIAFTRGFINSVDKKIFAFFPEYAYLKNEEKNKMTLEHFLTMTSGLEWILEDISDKDARNDVITMASVDDQIQFVLEKPVVSQPGTVFNYSSGNTVVLGEVIRKASVFNIKELAEKYLFSPLGIKNFYFAKYQSGVYAVSGDIYMLPRDMAKIGYLYLRKGIWKGKRILSEWWIKQSVTEYIPYTLNIHTTGYGYHWWLKTYYSLYDSFSARGWGGQTIMVVPALDLVAVFTGGDYEINRKWWALELFRDYILDAVLND